MVIEVRPGLRKKEASPLLKEAARSQITVFHCFNALDSLNGLEGMDYEVKDVNLPCSSMTRETVLLRAFEAGADAVVVLVCPIGECHYLQGNLRTAKRVARVKKMLDEIGLDGRRLNVYHVSHGDRSAVTRILDQTASDLVQLGPNPANRLN